MRYLAIDPGDKRTGLAVGDDETKIASPIAVIETANLEERLRQIGQAIQSHNPDALVVGLPLNMDGTEGEAVRKARAFAQQLTARFGLKVQLVDERLTSEAANAQLNESGLSRKARKVRRDALAAATILLDFLNSR